MTKLKVHGVNVIITDNNTVRIMIKSKKPLLSKEVKAAAKKVIEYLEVEGFLDEEKIS